MKKIQNFGINVILNLLKTICLVIFPIITFPIVSRALSVDGLGTVNYASSIVTYFSLIATLGVTTYGIREGAKLREQKKEFSSFVNEVFTINMAATAFAYLLLFLSVYFIERLRQHMSFIFIQSLCIIGTTLGMDWINSVYEDYWYITIRTILVQMLSMLLLLLFIHTEEDLGNYVLILVFSNVAANVLNIFYIRRYCVPRLTYKVRLKVHIKPILIIFFSGIASTIYSSLDITMLGSLSDLYSVGIYNVAGKIYTLVKQVLFAAFIVSLPRLSYYAKENEELYQKNVQQIFSLCIIFALPIMAGLFLLSETIVFILSGVKYAESIPVLHILSVALIFAVMAYFLMEVICLPRNREKDMMWATIMGAATDFILNFLLIPRYQERGAAWATLFAEGMVFLFLFIKEHREIQIKKMRKEIIQALVSTIVMSQVVIITLRLFHNLYLQLFAAIFSGAAVYFIIMYGWKNTSLLYLIKEGKEWIYKHVIKR